jgi:hypothetical protein
MLRGITMASQIALQRLTLLGAVFLVGSGGGIRDVRAQQDYKAARQQRTTEAMAQVSKFNTPQTLAACRAQVGSTHPNHTLTGPFVLSRSVTCLSVGSGLFTQGTPGMAIYVAPASFKALFGSTANGQLSCKITLDGGKLSMVTSITPNTWPNTDVLACGR